MKATKSRYLEIYKKLVKSTGTDTFGSYEKICNSVKNVDEQIEAPTPTGVIIEGQCGNGWYIIKTEDGKIHANATKEGRPKLLRKLKTYLELRSLKMEDISTKTELNK